jgi:hypothetical protein
MVDPKQLLLTTLPIDRECVTHWDDLAAHIKRFGHFGSWIFRGVNSSGFSLQTSLERMILALTLEKNPTPEERRTILAGKFGSTEKTVFEIEGGLIRAFRRRCHHYMARTPETPMEVLALMQHHEAPTRLLDWTYSFYVALYFALDRADIQRSDHSAVWALDTDWVVKQLRAHQSDLHNIIDYDRNMQRDIHTFKKVFRQERRFVCPVNPYFLNERLSIQQGLFLCPGSVRCSFEDNLSALQYQESSGVCTPVDNASDALVKINISNAPSTRKEILQHLHRMNMSRTSLFPGIDGFARSLENVLAFPDILEYGDKYEGDFPL